jgi:dTDP-4-dehydrorhamnose reductase
LKSLTASRQSPLLDKLLIIGSTGLVGSKVASLAGKHGFEPYNTQHSRKSASSDFAELDITDREATLALVGRIRPRAIINTAALTNVDYCETHTKEAQGVNIEGVRNLADAAHENQSRLIQISTDYVFDGRVGHYEESDTPNPIQYYGKTKLEAEKIVASLASFAIARPSVIFGWAPVLPVEESGGSKPMNFAMFVLDRLKRRENVKAIRDQYASPTFADNLAEALLRLARVRENGVFHTSGRSCLSRYEFAIRLAETFGYSKGQIEPVYSSEFKQLAERPRNSCLRVEKAERFLGMSLLSASEGIREMKKQESPQVSS